MPEINEVDRRVLDAMEGHERIKLLLRAKGMDNPVQDFAAHLGGRWAEQVSMCLRGDRPYEDIRESLAEYLEVSREQIDEWIDGPDDAADDAPAARSA